MAAANGTGTTLARRSAANIAATADALGLAPFFSQMLVGMNSFHEQYFVSNAEGQVAARWGDYFRRKERYAVYWAHYENNVYRKVHLWSDLYKSAYGLYSFTRSIYSPAYRLVEFWATHLMGGGLDPLAGDGKGVPSALPIVTDNELLRPAIARLWQDSGWQANKETFTRFGAAMGDVGLMAVDDPIRQFSYLKVIHPQSLRTVDRDARGNVTKYVLEELREDPEYDADVTTPALATYNEVCTKVGNRIAFATYRNGEPYDWRAYPDDRAPTIGPVWTEDYDFVPLRVVQHRDMGLCWGWSELHSIISKLNELDDLASKIDDAIRRQVDCPFFFTGVRDGIRPIAAPDEDEENTDRDWMPSFASPNEHAKAHPLIQPINVKECSDHALSILAQLERDHPELRADDIGPDASGTARRIAQEKVEAMVAQRRPAYDDATVRAIQMCLSIDEIKGYAYPGVSSFGPDAYIRGLLDFSIGNRPVFAVDPMDKLELDSKFWANASAAVRAGCPLVTFLRRNDWSEKDIASMEVDQVADAQRANPDGLLTSQTVYKGTIGPGGVVEEPAAPATAANPGAK